MTDPNNSKWPSVVAVYEYVFENDIAIPQGKTLAYTGGPQVGVSAGELYTLEAVSDGVTIGEDGNAVASDPGTYQVRAKLERQDIKWITDEEGGRTTEDQIIEFTILDPVSLENAKVALSKTSFTYNTKVQKPVIDTIKDLTLTEGTDYTVKWSNPSSTNAGTYTVTITGIGGYTGTTKATYKIDKAANPLTAKGRKVTIKYSKLKKKAQVLKATKAIRFTRKGQGTMFYKLLSVNKKKFKKYFKINGKTGKITVKKGLKKGTYKVKARIRAAGNGNYNISAWKTVTFKIQVK